MRLSLKFATLQTNIIGTANVLIACFSESASCCCVHFRQMCYENRDRDIPYTETDDRMGGHDPYSASKGPLKLWCFFPNHFIKTMGSLFSHCGNVIGGDWALNRIMTDMIEALMDGRTPIIRSWSIEAAGVIWMFYGYLSAIIYISQQTPGSFDQFDLFYKMKLTSLSWYVHVCDYWGRRQT